MIFHDRTVSDWMMAVQSLHRATCELWFLNLKGSGTRGTKMNVWLLGQSKSLLVASSPVCLHHDCLLQHSGELMNSQGATGERQARLISTGKPSGGKLTHSHTRSHTCTLTHSLTHAAGSTSEAQNLWLKWELWNSLIDVVPRFIEYL